MTEVLLKRGNEDTHTGTHRDDQVRTQRRPPSTYMPGREALGGASLVDRLTSHSTSAPTPSLQALPSSQMGMSPVSPDLLSTSLQLFSPCLPLWNVSGFLTNLPQVCMLPQVLLGVQPPGMDRSAFPGQGACSPSMSQVSSSLPLSCPGVAASDDTLGRGLPMRGNTTLMAAEMCSP